ncbi:MAG: hypothetical protein FJ009_21025 [Chloroflexi bacterium]|nr:hypothetical protein [Chloroflexota bacterium]
MNILKRQSRKPSRSYLKSNSRNDERRGRTILPLPKKVDAQPRLVYNTSERAHRAEVKLRVVPLRDVLLHEQIETKRVERLIDRLQSDQLLKNPPIVVESQGKYILLDGATRITALARVGCRDAVVQIVDYNAPGLTLETWDHLIVGLPVPDFLQALRQLAGLRLQVATAEQAEEARAQRASLGTVVLADGHTLSLYGAASLAAEAHLLNQVVALYEGRGEMYRVAHTDVKGLLMEHARFSALVIFPRYRPTEIRQLALNGSKLPTGITRHVIPGRAMRINMPLDVLYADEPLARKNAWLDEWMQTKMRERQVRLYQEPVFLFDE